MATAVRGHDARIIPPKPVASDMVAALERVWAKIREQNPDVPHALVVIGRNTGGKRGLLTLGHYYHYGWQNAHGTNDERTPEVFVAAECLQRGAHQTVTTLLHEAAHALSAARGIDDTRADNKYHNNKFVTAAAELGLAPESDDPHPVRGWSAVEMTESTRAAWADEIAALQAAIAAYSAPGEAASTTGTGKDRNNAKLVCACDRIIRASRKTLDDGPIICGVCLSPFATESV